MSANRILAIDPGSRDFGYARFTGYRIDDANAKSLRRPGEKADPVKVFKRMFRLLLTEHSPNVLVIEKCGLAGTCQHRALAACIAHVRATAKRENIRLYEFAPTTIKKTVSGYGHATKVALAKILCQQYPELKAYRGQKFHWRERFYANLFDAVACGLTYLILKDANKLRYYATTK